MTKEDFRQAGQIIQLDFEPVRIDIVNNIPAVEFDDAYPRRVTALIDAVSIHFIGLEDLKANKLAAKRNKDLNDVQAIEKVEKGTTPKRSRKRK